MGLRGRDIELILVKCLGQGWTLSNCSSYSVQFSRSVVSNRLFVTPWTVARQASLSITNSRSLLKLMSIESVMPSNNLILLSSINCSSYYPIGPQSLPTPSLLHHFHLLYCGAGPTSP